MAKIQTRFIETNDPGEVYEMQLKGKLGLNFYVNSSKFVDGVQYIDGVEYLVGVQYSVSIENNKIVGISHALMKFKPFTDEEMLKYITEQMNGTKQTKFEVYDYSNFSEDDMKKIKFEDSDQYDWWKIIYEVMEKGNTVELKIDWGTKFIKSINNINYEFVPIDGLGLNQHNLDIVACEKYLLELYDS